MASSALILETLKYLEKDKYTLKVYGTGSGSPIKIYTVGEIFDMVQDISTSAKNIYHGAYDSFQNWSGTLSTLKSSLNQFGYTALDSVLTSIKAALSSMVPIQKIMNVYRTVRPLMEKLVDIGGIKWNFAEIGKIAQDVLQYLQRNSVKIAYTLMETIWKMILMMPIFAIYQLSEQDKRATGLNFDNTLKTEEELIIDLTNLMNEISNKIDEEIEHYLIDLSIFPDIIKSTNDFIIGDGELTTIPSYSLDGISLNNEITSVSYNNNKMILSDKNTINEVTNGYNTKCTFITDKNIDKVFLYKDETYYLSDNDIYKVIDSEHDSYIYTLDSKAINFIDSSIEPIIITETGNFYTVNSNKILFNVDSRVDYTTFDTKSKVGYFVTENKVFNFFKNLNKEYISELVTDNIEQTIVSIGSFEEQLYIVLFNGETYSLKKINTYLNFEKYSFETETSINYVNDKFISNGKEIFRYTIVNDKINLVPLASNMPMSTTCISSHMYNNCEYLISVSNYNIMLTSVENEDWKVKALNYKPEDALEEPETFVCCFWNNDKFYICSQTKIYIINPEIVGGLFADIDMSVLNDLPAKKRAPKSTNELWKSLEIANVANGIDYSSVFNIPENNIICSAKSIDETIYISLFNINTRETGIYLLNDDNGIFTKIIDTNFIKPYYFDKTNNVFYYSNGIQVYKFVDEIKEIKLGQISNAELIANITHNDDDKIIIATDKSIFVQSTNTNFFDIKTFIELDPNDKLTLNATEETLLVSDKKFIYNITDDENIDEDIYQICYENTGTSPYEIIQSVGSAFIKKSCSLEYVPFNTALKSFKYHNGYFTNNGVPCKFAGAAPYFFAANALNSGKIKDKNGYIRSLHRSFKSELKKLLKNAPEAYAELLKEKIKSDLKKQNFQLEGDDLNIVVNKCIESSTDVIVSTISAYFSERFAEKLNSIDIYENFAVMVEEQCFNDKYNNITKSFYEIFSDLFYSTLKEVKISYNSINLEEVLLKYYQNHKTEWCSSIVNAIESNRVDSSIYNIAFDEFEEYKTHDDIYHQKFYDNLESTKTAVEAIIEDSDPNKKERIIAAINSTEFNIIPSDYWQNIIKQAVNNYYVPTQGDQYRQIVIDSNMYPINWYELPTNIDEDIFDTALTMLLDAIKNEIIQKICILVDKGKVLCYNCLDAKLVIGKLINENAIIYKNQLNLIRDIFKENISEEFITPINKEAILSLFVVPKIVKDTKLTLKEILDEQSKLYAKYLKAIIETQTLQTTSEVTV